MVSGNLLIPTPALMERAINEPHFPKGPETRLSEKSFSGTRLKITSTAFFKVSTDCESGLLFSRNHDFVFSCYLYQSQPLAPKEGGD